MKADERAVFPRKGLAELTVVLLIASIGCIPMLVLRIVLTGWFRYAALLAWDLSLAWVPYVLSLFMTWLVYTVGNLSKLRMSIVAVGVVWLLFYPNAPYVFTIFIHLIRKPGFIAFSSSLVTAEALLWYDVILGSLFSFVGHAIGLISLVIVHRLVGIVFNRAVGWAVVVVAILLSGYGVYLGRFERLNSWDLLARPLVTIRTGLLNLFNLEAVLFTLCFGFFIFLTYLVVYSFHGLRGRGTPSQS